MDLASRCFYIGGGWGRYGSSQPLQMGKKGVGVLPLQMRKNGVEHHRPTAVERLGAVEQGCHGCGLYT